VSRKFIRSALAPILLLSAVVSAAQSPRIAPDNVVDWQGWRLNPHSVGCELSNYYNAERWPGGYLKNTAFDTMYLRFSVNTFIHGQIIIADEIGKIEFGLQVNPRGDRDIADNQGIASAEIGGYPAAPHVGKYHDAHYFWLTGEQAADVFARFAKDQQIGISLHFQDGKKVDFQVFQYPLKVNHVWAAMLETCISKHRKR